jgi:hypothetical protein
MDDGVVAYIQRWQPSSVSPAAAVFARVVVTRAGPGRRERAKNLLWAAGKLVLEERDGLQSPVSPTVSFCVRSATTRLTHVRGIASQTSTP